MAPAIAQQAKPALAIPDAADAQQWRTWAGALGWAVLTPAGDAPANAAADTRLLSLATAIQQAIKAGEVDSARVYLAGRAGDAATVFYGVSRLPDLFAAAFAGGGSPQPAIDSNRIFQVNFTQTPVLWVGAAGDKALADKLKAAGMNLEWRSAEGLPIATAFDWLAAHKRREYPEEVTCETTTPTFGRCWWVQVTAIDAADKNDALPTTLIPGSAGARFDLGAFGLKMDDPGPGALVASLGEKYTGPLKLSDRLIQLDGRPIESARQLVETLAAVKEEKNAVVMVQRGNEKMRVETRIVVPRREEPASASVKAKYTPEEHEILIMTRAASALRVTLPEYWLPARLNWNGLALEEVKQPGCIALRTERELLKAERCAP